MGERMERIGRIRTDVGGAQEKKICAGPPDPPNPFSHCIAFFQSIFIEKSLFIQQDTADLKLF
jgi:hypothetical protein